MSVIKKITIFYLITGAAIAVSLIVFVLVFRDTDKSLQKETVQSVTNVKNVTTIMELKSSVFENGGVISSKYTCDGQNIHPPLDISGVPSEVKSLVIIMDDHDVPRNIRPDGVWDHWVVFNIPPTLSTINEAEKIAGVYGKNSGGKTEYTGPCPPDREHRYIFYLYALDIELPLEIGATKTQVLNAMTGHILSEARLTGRYDRINRR